MSDFLASGNTKLVKSLHGCNWRRLVPCDTRDWAGLPRNVLFDIMDKLTVIDDYVRFGAVCHSWRTIFVEEKPENIEKHCSQPFLLVPYAKTETATEGLLYSLSTGRVYENFRFRLPIDTYFQGSSFGWLVSIERKTAYNYHVRLQNPFLSNDYIIDLPPPDDLERQHVDVNGVGGWDGHYIYKSVLSSDPSLSHDFIVMAIMSRYQGLAFCKYGDTTWTSIGNWKKQSSDYQLFHDVIFFNKTKQFYALRYTGEVVAIDFRPGASEGPQLLQVMHPDLAAKGAIKAYLVEDVSGDLLSVYKYSCDTMAVYKLDLVEGNWIKLHSLCNSVLFLGMNGSISRSLSDCPGCQPNCVYFTEDIFSSYLTNQFYAPPNNGVYNVEDDTFHAHYNPVGPWLTHQILPAPIWLKPTLFRTVYHV